MRQERKQGIVEELAEVSSMSELKGLWAFGQVESNEYADAQFVPNFKATVARLRGKEEATMDVPVVEMTVEQELAALRAEVAAMKAAAVAAPKVEAASPVKESSRSGRKYRLLSDDLSWSTTPQVHGILAILKAHVPVGGVISDEDAVAAMVANEKTVLRTTQGGEKIWRYYVGKHERGLMAHGNLEIVP